MVKDSDPAWKVYEEELERSGKGLPRWFPEPLSDTRQVKIGDVVFQDREGEWHGLFNVLDGTSIRGRHLPKDFTPLVMDESLITERERVLLGGDTLATEGISTKEVTAARCEPDMAE